MPPPPPGTPPPAQQMGTPWLHPTQSLADQGIEPNDTVQFKKKFFVTVRTASPPPSETTRSRRTPLSLCAASLCAAHAARGLTLVRTRRWTRATRSS